jgi:hypothetical protein
MLVTEPKTGAFYMRMGETEGRMLDELGARMGLNRADVIRQGIRKLYAEVIGETSAPKRASKAKRKSKAASKKGRSSGL